MLPAPWLLAGALLLVGVGVAWTTDAVASVERVVAVREHDGWSEDARFTYVVPVEGEDAPLPMGEPGYFTTRSPRIPITFAWSAQDAQAAPLSGEATLVLRIVASADGKEAWRVEEPLARAEIVARTAELAGIVDFPKAEQAIEAARLEEGKRNETLSWSVLAIVSHARDGQVATSEFLFPMRYDAPLLVLPGADEAHETRAHARSEPYVETTRAGWRGLQEDPRGPAALAAGLAGIFLTARLRRTEAAA